MLASRFIETCQTISTETYLYVIKMSWKRWIPTNLKWFCGFQEASVILFDLD